MAEPIEIYECLDLKNPGTYIKFKNTHEGEYRFNEGKIYFTFLLIEIKSELPPTDCLLNLKYTHENSTLNNLSIHFMKYRKNFIYENGLYILYFDKVEEIKKGITPLWAEFKNIRDPKATAKLFYKTYFQSK